MQDQSIGPDPVCPQLTEIWKLAGELWYDLTREGQFWHARRAARIESLADAAWQAAEEEEEAAIDAA